MTRRRRGVCFFALAMFFALGSARAEPKKEAPPSKGAMRDAKHQLKEARNDLKEEKKELREALRAGADGGAAVEARNGVEAAREQLKAAEKKLHETRDARKRAHAEEQRKKWGGLLSAEGPRDEMRLHGRRMAKLHRIEEIAKVEGKSEIGKRVKELIEKEEARHEKRMEELKSKISEAKP